MGDELFSARDLLLEMNKDIKKLLASQAKVEERLAGGARHFEMNDSQIKDLQARKCPRFPKPGIVYSMITFGFIALGLLISIKG